METGALPGGRPKEVEVRLSRGQRLSTTHSEASPGTQPHTGVAYNLSQTAYAQIAGPGTLTARY